MAGNSPKFKMKWWPYTCAAWENSHVGKDGKKFLTHSVKLQKVYRDQAGQWKQTDQLDGRDLMNAARLLEEMAVTLGVEEDKAREEPASAHPAAEETF